MLSLIVPDSTDAIVPNVSLNATTTFASSATNLTLPDEFSISFKIVGAVLRPFSFLMNGVNASMEIALENFNGFITAQAEYHLDACSDVKIVLSTFQPIMERKFAVWALYAATYELIFRNLFAEVRFLIHGQGRLVGYLGFLKSSALLSASAGTGDNITNGTETLFEGSRVLSTSNNMSDMNGARGFAVFPVGADATDGANTGILKIQFLQAGRDLNIYDSFIVILAALNEAAEHPSTELVHEITFHLVSTDISITFGEMSGPPRAIAPFFQYQ